MDAHEAITMLKERNQNFVNKYGVTAFSKQTDEIIETLVNYYNSMESVKNSLQAIQSRLTAFNVITKNLALPVNELFDFPTWFLASQAKSKQKKLSADDYMYLLSIFNDYVFQTSEIDILVSQVKFYHSLEPPLNEWLLMIEPEIKHFINVPLENLQSEITEYYVRTLTH